MKNKPYGKTESFPGEKFPSDVFLVFGNRLLAVIVAAGIVMLPIRKEPAGGWAPQVSGHSLFLTVFGFGGIFVFFAFILLGLFRLFIWLQGSTRVDGGRTSLIIFAIKMKALTVVGRGGEGTRYAM